MQDDKDTIVEIEERAKATLSTKSRSYVDDAAYFARLALKHSKIIQDLMLHSATLCFGCNAPATHEATQFCYCDDCLKTDREFPDRRHKITEMPHAESIRAAKRMLLPSKEFYELLAKGSNT